MRGVRICFRKRLCSSDMASEHRFRMSFRSRSGVPTKRFFLVGLSLDPVVLVVSFVAFFLVLCCSPMSVESSESELSRTPYWFLVGVMGAMTFSVMRVKSHCSVVVFVISCTGETGFVSSLIFTSNYAAVD